MDKKTRIKFNILAIICIIIFAFGITQKTLQNDTYYTISIGQYIVENGIDRVDHFSWSDLAYTYPHWLYDVLMYLVYALRRNDRNIYFYYNIKLYTRNFVVYYQLKSK